MKKTIRLITIIAIAAVTSAGFISCKDKNTDASAGQAPPPPPPAAENPVNAAPPGSLIGPAADEALISGVAKISNDYPSVMMEVSDGEIILKGSLEKGKVKKLTDALEALKPKKITNDLAIK